MTNNVSYAGKQYILCWKPTYLMLEDNIFHGQNETNNMLAT